MPQTLDPADFIITRKRKKYKFAKFHNAPNCFELEQWEKRAVDVVEIGAGTGLFSLELARRHPEQQFVAIDVKADRLQKGAYLALEQGVTNVSFVRARADQIDQLFDAGSVSSIWVTFPDPFPRKRSAGRRLTHPTYLHLYADLLTSSDDCARPDQAQDRMRKAEQDHEEPICLRPGLKQGRLYLKHDNVEFFQWSLEQLVAQGWGLAELSFDLHESGLTDDYKILTTYEQRWLGEGLRTHFVAARVPNLLP